jgi:hypothetical protein
MASNGQIGYHEVTKQSVANNILMDHTDINDGFQLTLDMSQKHGDSYFQRNVSEKIPWLRSATKHPIGWIVLTTL